MNTFGAMQVLTQQWNYFKPLIRQLGLVLCCYSICRALFLGFNYADFSNSSFLDLVIAFAHGLRFDLWSIAYLNSLYILIYLIPIRKGKVLRATLIVLFVMSNGLALMYNLIDADYYAFTKKRSTIAVYSGNNEILAMIPQYVKSYWYLGLITIAFMTLMVSYGFKKQAVAPRINTVFHTICALLFIGLTVIATRGGLQLRPIESITASYYGNPNNAQLVLNTPFTLLQSMAQQQLSPLQYMSDAEALKNFNPVKQYPSSVPVTKSNVVIIILESFSKEFVGYLGGKKGLSPFLDSLMGESLVFEQAFANGKRSIEALPSILASIPSLANNAYMEMPYQDNALNALPAILQNHRYHTSFFHGGKNGTMNFDAFSHRIGIKDYYGEREFPDHAAIDEGGWGVFDGPFLQFMAMKLNQTPEPFFSSVFTLSAHHPYHLPDSFIKKHPFISDNFHGCLLYTDQSLKVFFEVAKQQPWFQNTLFIVTADHTGAIENPDYTTAVGNYRIPLFFYYPGKIKPLHDSTRIVQQVDILPSVVDFLHLKDPLISFGNSVFDAQSARFAITYNGSYYQLLQGNYVVHFNDNKLLGYYNFVNDPLLKTNLQDSLPGEAHRMQVLLQALVQTYNNRLINNQLTVK